jgi:predicted metal-dependent phosphoesterase TrpH
MRRFVDLHTHSTASDGTLSPRELVAAADARRLAAVALTDHDTIAGLAQAQAAARDYPNVKLVAGVELSAAWPQGTLHILGLGVDSASSALAELLGRLREARQQRNPLIIEKLRQMGLNLTMDDVLAEAPHANRQLVVGRLHIARAMVRRRHVRTTDEAFERYIGAGRPAYVDKERLTAAEAIAAVHAAGGVAVLAHPPQLDYDNPAQMERIIRQLRRDGIDAVEVYHSDSTVVQTRALLDVAVKLRLGITGGSDFHGQAKQQVRLGVPRVSLEMIGSMAARLGLAPGG